MLAVPCRAPRRANWYAEIMGALASEEFRSVV